MMSVTEMGIAKQALAEREGSTSTDKTKNIGYWSTEGQSSGLGVDAIKEWAKLVRVDGVIWASLPVKFNGTATCHPNLADQVLSHLRGLSPERKRKAELYVRRTPKQIDTEVLPQVGAGIGLVTDG